ncbi:MAG: hypothetical protein PUH29_00755 [Lachnospiraceae bacterium]|nr:hypothetical protein [Lachnospiraceae bacterium]MDY5497533.1 hypothetical protein [Anaerobutyricum sp.]
MKSLLFRTGQILCLLLFLLMIFHSGQVLSFAKDGLRAWALCVLPVLLPFIILSKFWIYYKIPELFLRSGEKLFPENKKLAVCLPVFIIGLCCGFPIGAVFISHLYEQHAFSKEEAESLLPLVSFVSPAFLAGYVRPMIEIRGRLWIWFLLSLYAPVIISFIIMMQTCKDRTSHSDRLRHFSKSPENPASLRKVWLSSLEIIFTIGIYMMLFSILSGLLTNISLFQTPLPTFLVSNLEITAGIRLLCRCGLFGKTGLIILSAAATAFGGFCTMAQIHSVVCDSGLSMKKYIISKAKTSLLTLVFCLIIFRILT